MHKPDSTPRSRVKRLLALAGILLIVAVAVNFRTIVQIYRGEKTFKAVVYGITAKSSAMMYRNLKIPEDMGDPKAKVRVEVFLRSGDGCHAPTLFLGQSLGAIDPKRIRVDFQDTMKTEARARWAELKLGCEQGIAINGKVKYALPAKDPSNPKKTRTIYLTGGHEQKWGSEELWAILDKELKAAYGGKGLGLSPQEFAKKMTDEQQRLKDEAQRAAEQGAADGSGALMIKGPASPPVPPPPPGPAKATPEQTTRPHQSGPGSNTPPR